MKKIILSILIISYFSLLFAQKANYSEIITIKNIFLTENNITDKEIVNIFPIVSNNQDTLAFVFNFQNAFVIISNYKELPPIKAFSTNSNYPFQNKKNTIFEYPIFTDIIIDDFTNFLNNSKKNTYFSDINKKQWQKVKNSATKNPKIQYGEFLESEYGQVNCHDNTGKLINVTNYYTPNNYAVGCVALTLTEILQYFEWPRIGTSSHNYTDNYGSTTGSHSINFEDDYYNWSLILNKYDEQESTENQQQELGRLAYHTAVAVNMDFEYNGSTSNINKIPNAASKYFRFTGDYIEKTEQDFWTKIDSNLINGFPMPMAIYTSGGAGHAIICDGLKYENEAQKYYHLNMGWWGDDNTWYMIQDNFNAGGYSNITAAVINMFPVPELETPEINLENETVEIEWYYSKKITPEAYELQVKIGAADWLTITDTITVESFDYKYESTEEHKFQIRAKVAGKWKTNSYSNYESIDIQKEINATIPNEFYVNPTFVQENIIIIKYKNLKNCIINIYNISGQNVYSETISKNYEGLEKEINLYDFQSGIYFMKLSAGETKKTVKFFKL